MAATARCDTYIGKTHDIVQQRHAMWVLDDRQGIASTCGPQCFGMLQFTSKAHTIHAHRTHELPSCTNDDECAKLRAMGEK